MSQVPVSKQETASSQIAVSPAPVGVIFGNPAESGCFDDQLAAAVTVQGAGFAVRSGGLSGRRVVSVVAGGSAEEIARSVERLLAGHRPAWIVAAGFATALDDRLRHGDILLAETVVGPDGEELSLSPLPDLVGGSQLKLGRLLSVHRAERDPRERRKMGQLYGAAAADCDSLAAARVCRRENVRFLAVRVISETVDEQVPADIRRSSGRPTLMRRVSALAGAVVHRPGSLKDYWRHYESTLSASAALAKALAEIVPQLR